MVGLRQGEKKRGGEIKILKRGSKLSQGVGVLKRGGGRLEPPNELRGKLEQNAEFKCCTCSRQKTNTAGECHRHILRWTIS